MILCSYVLNKRDLKVEQKEEQEGSLNPLYEELLNELDEEDEKRVLINYEVEKVEPRFRWEFQHESITEYDSVFRKIRSDY